MKKILIGIIIGLALPFLIDLVMFQDPTPQNITKVYEDGSFTGCIKGELCDESP